MTRVEVRWLAACGLLLGVGAALLWAAGVIDPDGSRVARLIDRIEDALDVSDVFDDDPYDPYRG